MTRRCRIEVTVYVLGVLSVNSHLDRLFIRRPELSVCRSSIQEAFEALEASFRAGGKLLLCGSGGSAADCEHWSGELLKGFASKRPLPAGLRDVLPPRLFDSLQGGLPAIPLPSLIALNTAFANDVSADLAFAQLVWALGSSNDVLVAISTSGNAGNACSAVEAAKAKGMVTVGMTGKGGGRLSTLVDIAIKAPEELTHEIQESHEAIYHCLCLMIEDAMFPESNR